MISTSIQQHRNCSDSFLSVLDLEKNLTERLQGLDAETCRKKIKVIGIDVELSLGGPTEEWIRLMERTLNDVFNAAYKKSGGQFENIKKGVEKLLEDINQNTTISFKGSKTMCIILMFECSTYSGLLDLLQYLTSQKYHRRLGVLAETLSTHFNVDIPVMATSKILPASLQNALDNLAECEQKKQNAENCHSHHGDEYKKSLKLGIECSSVEDLVYTWKMFQQGGAAHYLDNIADTLSEYSGKKITLSSSLNMEEFKTALEDIDTNQAERDEYIRQKEPFQNLSDLFSTYPILVSKFVMIVESDSDLREKRYSDPEAVDNDNVFY
ncbi:uncharacterized protein LOC128554989 [Mercenaria mercenaria]|uniref:uncharacterized protein LOC128554989 n=1 Tax=Mercenaria mercenaria TaxID=6596 RepID=UPI00234F05EF|nr:uncharacterized protein LOC128554989 [Mercenaria mercenaria]